MESPRCFRVGGFGREPARDELLDAELDVQPELLARLVGGAVGPTERETDEAPNAGSDIRWAHVAAVQARRGATVRIPVTVSA